MQTASLNQTSTIREFLNYGCKWLQQLTDVCKLHTEEQSWTNIKDLGSLLYKNINTLMDNHIEDYLLDEDKPMKYQNVTIKKNPKCNTWYARKRIDGKQHTITGRTKIECYNNLKEFLKPKNIQMLKERQKEINRNLTLDQWYQQWFNLYKKNKVSKSTERTYRTLYNKIPDELKNLEIQKITLAQMIQFINSIKTLKNRQQSKTYEFLNAIFEKAVDNEIIKTNIMRKIDHPSYNRTHSEALDFNEQQELINVCNAIKNSDFIKFGLFQGTRKGETLGLTREDIDFENRTINISRAYQQDNSFGKTKNTQSIRKFPMFDNTYKLLEKYKDLDPKERIFNISNKQFELIMKKFNELYTLRHIAFKDMRATFITNCFYNSIPKQVIQGWSGHKIGSNVTESVYLSYLQEQNDEYIQVMNDYIGNYNL